MAGRPTVKTEEVIRKIEEVAALDGSVEEMAYYAGIHRDTLYAWLKDDPELSDRIGALRQRPILKARQTITKALDDPNHAFKYLEKKRRKEFGNSLDVTTDGEKIVSDTKELKEITTKLNELYRGAGISSDGKPSGAMGD